MSMGNNECLETNPCLIILTLNNRFKNDVATACGFVPAFIRYIWRIFVLVISGLQQVTVCANDVEIICQT